MTICSHTSDHNLPSPVGPKRWPVLKDSSGATVVEFAMLAPIFLALLLGVMTMGTYLQNFNAMRSAANDTTRQITVAYQRANKVQASEIENLARGVAVQAPYMLDTDRLDVTVQAAATSRVPGATEFTLRINYQLIGLPLVPVEWMVVSYERPIFVV